MLTRRGSCRVRFYILHILVIWFERNRAEDANAALGRLLGPEGQQQQCEDAHPGLDVGASGDLDPEPAADKQPADKWGRSLGRQFGESPELDAHALQRVQHSRWLDLYVLGWVPNRVRT